MSDLDELIREKIVPFRKRILEALAGKHPHIFKVLNAYFSGKSNNIGMQVTENGKVIGEYTFYLDGLDIARVESKKLSSEIHHPFGVIKPYGIVEKSYLEKMLEDEQGFITEPFSTAAKYMPGITVKFMR